jgi:hypothetical protein
MTKNLLGNLSIVKLSFHPQNSRQRAMSTDQIHLEAAEVSDKIIQVWEELQNGTSVSIYGIFSIFTGYDAFIWFQDEKHQTKIAEAVRFFGKNVKRLVECNDAMLTVGKSFLVRFFLPTFRNWILHGIFSCRC